MSKTVSGTTSQFLWDVAGSLPLLLKDGSTAYIYGPGRLPLEQVNGSTVLWMHHDQLGSTRLVTDSTGASQATYTFDAYGNLTATTGTITNPFGFAGQYRDGESSLYYLRARYYDPSTGQFLSRDPAVATTREPYGYVTDNPLNNTDPTGLYDCGWAFWNCVHPENLINGDNRDFVNNFQNGGYIAVGLPLVAAGGFAAVGLATTATAASIPTVAGMPIVPTAMQKLSDLATKFGTDEDTLAGNVLQNGTRFIDNANNGNINCLMARPDAASGFVRLTLDPNSQRIISAGLMQARNVLNGIISGRFQLQ